MDLPDFPLIDAPDYPLKEPFYKPQVRNEFENGDVQARPRFTRGRKKFAVAWEKLPHEQYAVLENFFKSGKASCSGGSIPRPAGNTVAGSAGINWTANLWNWIITKSP